MNIELACMCAGERVKGAPLCIKCHEALYCGALVHTRGWEGMPGPIYCANRKPCKTHKE